MAFGISACDHIDDLRRDWTLPVHAQQNEIANAKVAHLVRRGAEHGVVAGSITVDMATVRWRKREMVECQIAAHLQKYKASGAELIMGGGRFMAPKTLEVILNDGGTRVSQRADDGTPAIAVFASIFEAARCKTKTRQERGPNR